VPGRLRSRSMSFDAGHPKTGSSRSGSRGSCRAVSQCFCTGSETMSLRSQKNGECEKDGSLLTVSTFLVGDATKGVGYTLNSFYYEV